MVDSSVVPEILTKEFFENALRSYKKDNTIILNDLFISPGPNPVDHVTSVMFKAKVKYISTKNLSSEKHLHLIVKTVPCKNGVKLEIIQSSSAFTTEMKMYDEVLPAMEKLLQTIDIPSIIGPRLFFQTNQPVPVIALLDETPNGFESYQRRLELLECKVAIERLAKFHACSYFMSKNGYNMTQFKYSLYEKLPGQPDFFQIFFLPAIKSAVNEVKQWSEQTKIFQKMVQNLVFVEERVQKLYMNREEHQYRVLCHGDYTFKNMMYKNDGLKSEDYLLIDFQFCLWNSPASDLIYFLYAVANQEVREIHRKYLIESYFNQFRCILEKLGMKKDLPQLLDLQIDLLRFGILEYILAIICIPFNYIDRRKSSLEKVIEKKDFFSPGKAAWKNPKFMKEFIQIINRLSAQGSLD